MFFDTALNPNSAPLHHLSTLKYKHERAQATCLRNVTKHGLPATK